MVKNKLCAIVNLTEDNTVTEPLTNARPIAALPFASRYRIIDFVLSDIAYAGISSLALFIGDSGRSIYDHIRSGESWDLNNKIHGGVFTFSQQNWKKQNYSEDDYEDFYFNHRLFLERSNADYVFVSGSSIIANVDIQAVTSQHKASGKDVTVIYSPMTDDLDNVTENYRIFLDISDESDVRAMGSGELATADRINVGLNMYVLSVEKLNEMIDQAMEEGIYLDLDALLEQYLTEYSINAYEYTGYVAKINSIDSYYQANIEMLDRKKFASLLQTSIPILTKEKNGSPTYYSSESKVVQSIIGSDVSIYGNVEHSLVNRRVDIADGAEVEDSILLQGVKVGEGAKIKHAIIDKNAVIDAGVELVGTPDDIIVVSKGSHIKA